MELPDEEKEMFACEEGNQLEYVGLLKRKVRVRHSGRQCSLASALRALSVKLSIDPFILLACRLDWILSQT